MTALPRCMLTTRVMQFNGVLETRNTRQQSVAEHARSSSQKTGSTDAIYGCGVVSQDSGEKL